eukprot:CAMPEP_0197828486 /NCGR_PEP_ID=MMETSP1437-20131217/5040_1 /TAXON_ID=49252 ORGANISM="Eucampia antarctica, Strain CCMP1452" /NCGR_SAMPLE_ID=MMETSP1437 /ASSEMBLY_ACC=CAM_ASM_001096 /LENGTH=255 /DNA_ID=CAMNT_0043429705 /DNA_START=94 /DNA_END=861 /DNA_ORIENTATION=+
MLLMAERTPLTLGFTINPTVSNTVQWSTRNNSPDSTTTSTTTTRLSMAATLYGSQGSRSPLVNWGAYELDVPLEMANDMSQNPHPFGQIPCLTDDNGDVLVFESGAILQYVYSKSKSYETDSAAKKASVSSWVSWANASLDPICFLETPEGKVYDTGFRGPNRRIDTLNEHLSTRTFMLGDGFSLADVAVASYLLYVIQFFPDVDFSDRWSHIVRYMKQCAERDNYAKAFGSQVQTSLVNALDNMGKKKKMFGMF